MGNLQEYRKPALRTIAMPRDANINGDVFGGWVMAQMDLAGANIAWQRAEGRVVTVAVDAMTFHLPIMVGDEVSCYADVVKVGRTSMTVQVETWSRRYNEREAIKVTEGIFTYVAVDDSRKPRPVPAA